MRGVEVEKLEIVDIEESKAGISLFWRKNPGDAVDF